MSSIMLTRRTSKDKRNYNTAKASRKVNLNRQSRHHRKSNKKRSNNRPISREKKTTNEKKLNLINSRVNNFFEKMNLESIARKTKYLMRESPITPFIFLYAFSMQLFATAISMDLLAIQLNTIFCTNITGQALCLRMGQKKSVKFLKACFEECLNMQLQATFSNSLNDVFSMFKGIILEDSTTITLNERVKNLKGCGGAGSKSSLKLNWVFNMCCYAAVAVDLYSGSIPDQKNATKNIKFTKRGMLIIRDLGYFTVAALKEIVKKSAYYLSRVPKGSYLYHNIDDIDPIDISTFFKKITQKSKSVKIPIFIGKVERFSTYLVLAKVPKWVLNQRIKQYKKNNSAKKPSDEYITWARYSVFCTNIPDELFQNHFSSDEASNIVKVIKEIYKVRWQIELIFKKFKSIIKLNVIKAKSKERVFCLVYGKLISIMLTLMVLSYTMSHKYMGREASLWKITAWLAADGRLAKAILTGKYHSLFSSCLKHFKFLCKNSRERKTTQGVIEGLLDQKTRNQKDCFKYAVNMY